MSLTPEPVRVWLGAWPLPIIALIAGAICVRTVNHVQPSPEDQGDPLSRRTSRAGLIAAAIVWTLAVPAPIGLFASSLHSASSLTRFWSESTPAVIHSTAIAAIVGAVSALLALASWSIRTILPQGGGAPRALTPGGGGHATTPSIRPPADVRTNISRPSSEDRHTGHREEEQEEQSNTLASLRAHSAPSARLNITRLTLSTLTLFTTAALIPGILIGSSTASFWNAPFFPREVGDSDLPLILAHIARFAFLPLLAGWWLGAMESQEQRDSRTLFAPGLAGWWALRVRANPAAPIGIALACATLSLHEIEATVLLQPPGAKNLAQRLMDLLHYARDEQLAAAAVNIGVLSLAFAMAAAVLLSRSLTRRLS